MKTYCKNCGIEKTKDNTSRHSETKDRLQRYCKECDKKRVKKWYQDNIKHARKKRKEWQDNNMKTHIEHVKKYLTTDKGKATQERYMEKIKNV